MAADTELRELELCDDRADKEAESDERDDDEFSDITLELLTRFDDELDREDAKLDDHDSRCDELDAACELL